MIKMKHIILSNYHLFRRPMDMHGQHSVGNGEISIEWWQWCQQWVSLFLGLGQLMTLSNCPLKVHRGAFSVRQLKLASLLHSTLLLCPVHGVTNYDCFFPCARWQIVPLPTRILLSLHVVVVHYKDFSMSFHVVVALLELKNWKYKRIPLITLSNCYQPFHPIISSDSASPKIIMLNLLDKHP